MVSQDQSPAGLKLAATITDLLCGQTYAKLPGVNEKKDSWPPQEFSQAQEEGQWYMAVLNRISSS